jgi:hypothetical protein
MFSSSQILTGLQQPLLYANLPLDLCEMRLKPTKITPAPTDNDGGGFPQTTSVLNFFEMDVDHTKFPNLILFEVPGAQDAKDVIGGFSSHGWTTHAQLQPETASYFLFNLSQNVRLDALHSSAEQFTFVREVQEEDWGESSNQEFGNKQLAFGRSELLI